MKCIKITFEDHEITGRVDLDGPFSEVCDSELTDIHPPNDDAAFNARALEAIEWEAQQRAAAKRDEDAYDDDYDERSGGDYWVDRDSGEVRCG
jgi:hypothetical protein